jgi:O-acetyl-ADP-ribose deacetylase (regulator of RNase III)
MMLLRHLLQPFLLTPLPVMILENMVMYSMRAVDNTVNCVGIMGKGIALQFKQKWPENFKAYDKACKAKEVHLGKMLLHELGTLAGKPHYIINFPTKDHWRGKSQIQFIEDGLKDLVAVIKQHNIRSIAIPPLGCGNGGLNWNEVRPLIERF